LPGRDRRGGALVDHGVVPAARGTAVADVPDLGAPLQAQGVDWQLRTASPTVVLERLTGWARSRDLELAALTVQRPSLEDVYLELIGAAGAEEAAAPEPEAVLR
ncbi:MAG: hypothetical protein ACTHKG_12585, partial [Nocardioides sp.]